MSFIEDEEILQDFLVEAGEILELLGQQLVDLENYPEDSELLNAVFRGFHTIKGGAGFLNIPAMIDICHRAEDVFNVLRQGERKVDADLMDTVLNVVDILNDQFEQLSAYSEPEHADPKLLHHLERLALPQAKSNESQEQPSEPKAEKVADTGNKDEETPASPLLNKDVPTVTKSDEPVVSNSNEITEDEFEALLDVLEANRSDSNAKDTSSERVDGKAESAPTTEKTVGNSDDISDEEFEALLDDLHGEGQHSVVENGSASVKERDITEEEFESLLDDMHGKGKHTLVKSKAQTKVETPAESNAPDASSADITEQEFDNLLDDIHGKDKHRNASKQLPAVRKSDIESPKNNPSVTSSKAKAVASKKPQLVKQETSESTSTNNTEKTPVRSAETTVRVDTKRLDDIMNMVGELVLVRNRLETLKIKINDNDITKAVANLNLVTADLQASVMKTRMQPIKKVFGRFPRVVRDLARNLNKRVKLELVGEETDLDKNLVEALADPMIHLVRNSVDHGIETPADRQKIGKNPEGVVRLSAAQEGDHIQLLIEDDGAGMDANFLKEKSIEKGLLTQESASRMTDKEAFNMIFAPGFSTKTEVSDVSGRGVGMDVVKTRISQLNGSIEIDSKKGKGSTFRIKLPLTLAILPTLMVKIGSRTFALPLSSVNEIFSMENYTTSHVNEQLVIMVRESAMPLFYLYDWLDEDRSKHEGSTDDQVVVASVGGKNIGFVVNQVIGQEEVVIKPLGMLLHGLPGFAGATITGDGRIALILDMPGLLRSRA